MRDRGMRTGFAFALLLFMAAPVTGVNAAGMYVRDWISAAVREAPHENAKIVGGAETNDYLEIFEGRTDWSKVKTPKGIEGWVQNRYLTRQTPKALIIDQLNEKIKSLTDQNLTLKEENSQLQRESRDRNYRMSGFSREIEDAKKQYETLKLESNDYLTLKKNYDDLQAQHKATSEKMALLARENSRMKTSERLIFTLVGGGFIIIGLVIGTLLQFFRAKPKKGGYKF